VLFAVRQDDFDRASGTGYREDDFETYLYMSKDFGETWKSIAGNLPSESVNVIREDPSDKDMLYVGTELGAYCSIDRGKTWHSLCNHLPTTPVHDIAVHPREDDLVVGTHGRSAFVLDIEEIKKIKSRQWCVVATYADVPSTAKRSEDCETLQTQSSRLASSLY